MIKVCPNQLMQYANRESNAIMTIVLARPPLGSLVVRLITGDAIRISGVGHLGVAIQSLVRPSSMFQLSFRHTFLGNFKQAPLPAIHGGFHAQYVGFSHC